MMALRENQIRDALAAQGVRLSPMKQAQFIKWLLSCVHQRKQFVAQAATIRYENNILGQINRAREAGDLDEAVWRSFLAIHFGDPSLCNGHNAHSAVKFLCAFGNKPYWTWKRTHKKLKPFRLWLQANISNLRSLSFANHRKHESKKSGAIGKVVKSFVEFAKKNGGPLGCITVTPTENEHDTFRSLYYRLLKELHRFGRLAAFDLVVLLSDMQLVVAEPDSLYLEGASGPLAGAEKLYGKLPVNELDPLCVDLARRLGISLIPLEDCLCIWQKKAKRKKVAR
jgi:hypothetical protein